MMRLAAIRTALLVMVALSACNKAPPVDNVCSYGPLPATSEVPPGQGGVVTQAATDAYFYAFDGAGKQVGSAHVNALLPLKPGEYQLKVNNSVHMGAVESATLTKCPTGGVLVNRSEEHTSELQSLAYLVCRLLLEKKKKQNQKHERASTN